MIHLFKKIYLHPNGNLLELPSYSELYEKNQPLQFSCSNPIFTKAVTQHWKTILNNSSSENQKWLWETLQIDLELKGKRSFLPDHLEESNSDAHISPAGDELSFEHVLASYLMWPELCANAMKKKIEYLSWEQIIQEISVIRYEVNLLLFNRKINRFLPAEYQIDHDEDIEIQLFHNPLLNWIFDPEYSFSNVEYFKKHVDLEAITHFYDSWMIARRSLGKTEEEEKELDNLSWITSGIIKGEWEKLLDANLNRNFGCIYLDNTMIEKGNQVWASALLRDYNRKDKTTASKLALKPELFSSSGNR